MSDNKKFVDKVMSDVQARVKHNKISLGKLAAGYGITNTNLIKELTELAIVKLARAIAQKPTDTETRFQEILDLYKSQATLSHRTSLSILLQQYSTAAPIAFLAGIFTDPERDEDRKQTELRNRVDKLVAIKKKLYSDVDIASPMSEDEKKLNKEIASIYSELNSIAVEKRENFWKRTRELFLQHYRDKTLYFKHRSQMHEVVVEGSETDHTNEITVYTTGHQRVPHRAKINNLYTQKNPDFYAKPAIDKLLPLQKKEGKTCFEPSAGNGLLTIAWEPSQVTVNEIDEVRRANLETQGYAKVMAQDASKPFKNLQKTFDAVLTNPPFGSLQKPVFFGEHKIKPLDHAMAIYALEAMKDEGKAAIIIGGHTAWDAKGRVQLGKNRIFIDYLHVNYNVVDIINIDGSLYSKQGTSFDIRLILIDGRKSTPSGFAPIKTEKDVVIKTFNELYDRVMLYCSPNDTEEETMKIAELEAQALQLELELMQQLEGVYVPGSESGKKLDVNVPDSMDFETHQAVARIKEAVGGSLDKYVIQKLKFKSEIDLVNALSAEQIDAVAMAVYNIEERKQAIIIGDQTGIGKGRIAAAVIRYAVENGDRPIFLTEKPNLFSDIYRDLKAIGCQHYKPFIINARDSKTDIKDEDGEVIYQAPPTKEQENILKSEKLPKEYNFICSTYSQFNSPDKKPIKPGFLKNLAYRNVVIMDESHNSSGTSNTGAFLQTAIGSTRGTVFLSATFAKRPDNMPVYAMKTAMMDTNMTRTALVEAIIKGGVALQEVVSAQLVMEGQMLRRERSYEGIEVNYLVLDKLEKEHQATADAVTEVVREIIRFQAIYVDSVVEEFDEIQRAASEQVEQRKGTSAAGVDNTPYFSKVFNVINQMLFSIKAESVADRAIQRLKEGKKPVIAFSNTMGSFIEDMEFEEGETVDIDFSQVLLKGLQSVMKITRISSSGKREPDIIRVEDLSQEGQEEYHRIALKCRKTSTGITISPIDVIVHKLTEAGYRVAEVTGRKSEVQLNKKRNAGIVVTRRKVNTNDAFRLFNNNEVDVLLINQSGSTGASAHAIITNKVPREQVKQRVMIVLQAELNINTEVQKRGRINRTGQILKPIYDYISSAIPAEKRLMMMLQKKLKSLDANTASNQKQSKQMMDTADFLNKYGDAVVVEYLRENREINRLLDNPLKMDQNGDVEVTDEQAHKVTGRVAVLSTRQQREFYDEIMLRYNDYVEYLKQAGEYDLEVETMDLQAKTIKKTVVAVGKSPNSVFGEDSVLEVIEANVLRKPFTKEELQQKIQEALGGKTAKEIQSELKTKYKEFREKRLADYIENELVRHSLAVSGVEEEKAIKSMTDPKAKEAAIGLRKNELQSAFEKKIATMKDDFVFGDQFMNGMFDFFTIGRGINYPTSEFDRGSLNVAGIFLGFAIDERRSNPYAASAIKLRFALANSTRYISFPASGKFSMRIGAIKGESYSLTDWQSVQIIDRWEEHCKTSLADRNLRHVVTGNLLQAYATHKGNLVSFTMQDGSVRKGILMPENWTPKETGEEVSVPLLKAINLIKSVPIGKYIVIGTGISLFRLMGGYKFIVPASRVRGGDIYLDEDVLKWVETNNFNKVSEQMVTIVLDKNLDSLLEVLQNKHGLSVKLSADQFAKIADSLPKPEPKKIIDLPAKPVREEDEMMEILEYEAEALQLELELLKIRKAA